MAEAADAAETAGAQAVADIGDLVRAAENLQQAAQEGKFAVDPQHGKELVDFLRDWRKEFGREMDLARSLAQRLPLGSSPGAQVYGPFFSRSASDSTQGLLPNLQHFIEVLQETEDALIQSMKHYAYADEQAAEDGRRIMAELDQYNA